MSIERKQSLYEILIRFDGSGGLAGAHQCEQEIVSDGETVFSHTVLPATVIDPSELAKLIDDERLAPMIAQIQELQTICETLGAERNTTVLLCEKLQRENEKLTELIMAKKAN